jgi:hypothetical protein
VGSVFHDVVLQGLQGATTYYYVAGDAAAGFSTQFSFVTPPATSGVVSIAVYGESSWCQLSAATVEKHLVVR